MRTVLNKLDLSLNMASQSVTAFKMAQKHAAAMGLESCNNLENLVAALLLIGSLHHELCDPLGAQAYFEEASEAVGHAGFSISESRKLSSLLPLIEIANLLAYTYCAPEA